jgi:hypothetical protein
VKPIGVLPTLRRSIRGEEQECLLLSDLHIGSRLTDYNALTSVIGEAKHRKMRVLILGDVVDAILPRDTKRFHPSVLHKRLQGKDNVLDETVDWAAEILDPVRGQIDLMAYGNHETAVISHHNTDPIDRLAEKLGCPVGGYSGIVDYRFDGTQKHVRIGYWHGKGRGSSPKSVIDDWAKLQGICESLDVVWTGHRHHRLVMEYPKLSPSPGTLLNERRVYCVCTGSYQRPYADRLPGRNDNFVADSLIHPGGLGSVTLKVQLVKGRVQLGVSF